MGNTLSDTVYNVEWVYGEADLYLDEQSLIFWQGFS